MLVNGYHTCLLKWSRFQSFECVPLRFVVGPILCDRLKEKVMKPWNGVLCIHFRVRSSVYPSVRLLTSFRAHLLTYRNLIVWFEWSLGFVFRNIPCLRFLLAFFVFVLITLVGPLLDDRLKKRKRVSSVFTFVSVCARATEHTFWSRNLIFGLKDPWDMRTKRIFFLKFWKMTFVGSFVCVFFPSLSLYLLDATSLGSHFLAYSIDTICLSFEVELVDARRHMFYRVKH